GLGTTATRAAIRRLQARGVLDQVRRGGGRANPALYRFASTWLAETQRLALGSLNPTPESGKPNAAGAETQRLSDETQRIGVEEPSEPSKAEPSGTLAPAA